jgi:hypothetical protein
MGLFGINCFCVILLEYDWQNGFCLFIVSPVASDIPFLTLLFVSGLVILSTVVIAINKPKYDATIMILFCVATNSLF